MTTTKTSVRRMTLIHAVPHRSLFEWRDQLFAADKIIAALNKPRPAQIGCRRDKPSKGTDLSAQRDSLAKFLAWLAEVYLVASDDYELLSVRRWFRLPSQIVSAADEAIFAGQTNIQVAETLNAQFPGLGMTGVYAASFRRSLKNSGNVVPTSLEARRSQKAHK